MKEGARKNKKAHLIGICGKGMAGLALLLRERGFVVSGSDSGFYDPIFSMLKKNRVKFSPRHSPENIPKEVDLIVIGKHSELNEDNKEVRRAFASSAKIVSLAEALSELSEKKENTLVVGSSGKSTATALLAWCILKTNKDPSYFIGALPFGFKKNAHWGKGKQFVIEGDEYPSSNWDKTPKFLHFSPKNVLLLGAEHDHMNVFPTERLYKEPYKKLMLKILKGGLLVYAGSGKNNREIIKGAKCKKISYGLGENSVWQAKN